MKTRESPERWQSTTRIVSMVLIGMAMIAVSVSTATAMSPEPLTPVGATFGLHLLKPQTFQFCGRSNTFGVLTTVIGGTEIDASAAPHPELAGKLQATLRLVSDISQSAPQPAVGTFAATLHGADGTVSFEGSGTVIGKFEERGSFEGRGVFNAVLYSNGQPTSEHLLANLAIIMPSSNRITGGLGSGAPDTPTFAAETSGRHC